jgi:hypothetical protein
MGKRLQHLERTRRVLEGCGRGCLEETTQSNALVLVTGFMRSIKSRAGPRLAKKYDLEDFFSVHSFYFTVRQNTGFSWISWEEAENFKIGKNANSSGPGPGQIGANEPTYSHVHILQEITVL